MRYIGSKATLLSFIEAAVRAHDFTGGVFCDAFAGTTTVGRHFKRKGFQIISNDLMHYSYVFGKAYLECNAVPDFAGLDLPLITPPCLLEWDNARLERVLTYLNALPAEQGFIYNNYCDVGSDSKEHQRMYFSAANAGKIDAIRNQIERWQTENFLTDMEYFVLLASLLEAVPGISNTTGAYSGFLKFWQPRSQNALTLTPPPLVCGDKLHKVYIQNSNELIRHTKCDVLYIDPPYNFRQYALHYHILETISRWDNPSIYGKTGLRPYDSEKSVYCQKRGALTALTDIAQNAQCQLLLLSYSNEGIISHEQLCEMMGRFGHLTITEKEHRRYRTDNNHSDRQHKINKNVIERIYALRVERA